ncbi:MAG: GrpB family protein [Caldilineaceae bacterium]|nr:GrpB family protein [Caldilineaceae bacterium]
MINQLYHASKNRVSHSYFTKDADAVRTHDIHIYAADNPAVERHLAFRDYLRAHPAAQQAYVAVKHLAYAQHPADIIAYNNSKNA